MTTEKAQQYSAVQAVQAAVTPKPPACSDGTPVVYGYIRVPSDRQSYVTVCRIRFALYCVAKGYLLAQVFVDPSVPAMQKNRFGFGDLHQALQARTVYGVLVVHPRHLSTNPALFTTMTNSIQATGARLLALRGVLPSPSSDRGAGS